MFVSRLCHKIRSGVKTDHMLSVLKIKKKKLNYGLTFC